MAITLEPVHASTWEAAAEEMARWQHDDGSVQLHPGDLGWNASLGVDALVRSVRVWRRDGEAVALGMVSDDGLVRMSLAADEDEELAERLLADLSGDALRPGGVTTVEARCGTVLRDLLTRRGWTADESWTPFRLDLAAPVPDPGLHVVVADERDLADRVAVQRASFPTSTFSAERWHAMAATAPYRRARCLVGYDGDGNAVAAVTVWSAGPGRPGLLEPLGVHRDHRGHGHGVAISVAAAAALRELGASTATVWNTGRPAGKFGYRPPPVQNGRSRRRSRVDPVQVSGVWTCRRMFRAIAVVRRARDASSSGSASVSASS